MDGIPSGNQMWQWTIPELSRGLNRKVIYKLSPDLGSTPAIWTLMGIAQERVELGAADWRFPLPGGVVEKENHRKTIGKP